MAVRQDDGLLWHVDAEEDESGRARLRVADGDASAVAGDMPGRARLRVLRRPIVEVARDDFVEPRE